MLAPPRLLRRCLVTGIVLLALAPLVHAAVRTENRFGSILIDGKKAGQIHYTIEYADSGDVETLRTRASLSILGVKLFNFEQNLHERWHRGELRELHGRTEDDGEIYEASLERGATAYKGTLNGNPIELTDKAFPASVWHYAIVNQTLLFDLKTLKLLNVKVVRSDDDTVTVGGRTIRAERFDFSGDWRASAWFDAERHLVQFKYLIDGHDVLVKLED